MTGAFVRGQRWLCETQPELGLGVVEAVEHRRVRLYFPATGERRTFAAAEAPLARAEFGPGDRVRDVTGADWLVTDRETAAGLYVYRARGMDGCEERLPEGILDPRLRLNHPRQRLLAGRLHSNEWFRLRLATWRQLTLAATSPVRGLLGARVSPIPHQLFIAAEVASRAAPRVLLADEVGLGKTIEAGLILHRLLLEGRVQRVLILVPGPLLHQWLVELLRRFHLPFALFDRERLASAADGNPFDEVQRALCPLDLLTADPAAATAALAADWDLLIVDEAHHLRWTPEGESPDYALVAGLAARTPAVLLLTATPEQLGRSGHFGRLRLLDPERFGDYDAFLAEETGYAEVAAIACRLLDDDPLDPAAAARLTALLGGTDGLDQDEVVARLLDRHGTSRLLFRNTRAAISGFPVRQPLPEPLTGGPADRLWPEADWGDGEVPADDPRVPWLIETLRRLRPAKVLLITARADTVLALRRALQTRCGLQAAVFHEDMAIVERDRAAAFFADPDEGSQVLLCSEIGSEGRNFQFAHHLILFDLPLDPELLEQRIGRLDRIGQIETVHLHLPYLVGGPGEVLYRWYAEGLDAFRAPSPAAAAVHERLGSRLQALLAAVAPDPAAVATLLADAAALRLELEAALAAGRDRLLELGSHRPAVSGGLVEALVAADRDPGLRDYLNRFWDAFGIDHEPGRTGTTVLRPGAHMLEERFPGLPEDGLTVCFDRAHALAHEDHAFLTREHPLVRTALDLVTSREFGTAAIWLTRHRDVPAGTLLLEVIAVADCPAPPALGAERFLPPQAVRWLLDEQGRDRAAGLAPLLPGDEQGQGQTTGVAPRQPHHEPARDPAGGVATLDPDQLPGRCLNGNRPLIAALLKARAEPLAALLAAAEQRLGSDIEDLRTVALARIERELTHELDRLTALAAVNPAVRTAELAALATSRDRLAEALGQARLRLDALRLIAFT